MESQSNEGYGCLCGEKFLDKKELQIHLMKGGKADGKGVHKSLGRINMETGEVIIGPWVERTRQQKKDTTYAVRHERPGENPVRLTDNADQATEIRVVPRVFSMDFTPIMRLAKAAATREWNWPPDMSYSNFFDTCLYRFFREHGIRLAGYIVEESATEEEESNAG